MHKTHDTTKSTKNGSAENDACNIVRTSSSAVSTLGGAEEDLGTDCGGLEGVSLRAADGGGLDFDSCSA